MSDEHVCEVLGLECPQCKADADALRADLNKHLDPLWDKIEATFAVPPFADDEVENCATVILGQKIASHAIDTQALWGCLDVYFSRNAAKGNGYEDYDPTELFKRYDADPKMQGWREDCDEFVLNPARLYFLAHVSEVLEDALVRLAGESLIAVTVQTAGTEGLEDFGGSLSRFGEFCQKGYAKKVADRARAFLGALSKSRKPRTRKLTAQAFGLALEKMGDGDFNAVGLQRHLKKEGVTVSKGTIYKTTKQLLGGFRPEKRG